VTRFHYSVRRGDRLVDSGSIDSGGAISGIRIQAAGGDDLVDVAGRAAPLPGGAGVTAVTIPVTVFGDTGNDVIYGGDGADRLNGSAGDDQIDGGGGDDWIGSAYFGAGTAEFDVEYTTEPGNDRIAGGAGDDVIDGGAGADLVSGGDGADKVWGGGDADEVRGEGGSDTFYASDDPAERRDRESDEAVLDLFEATPSGTEPVAGVEDGVLVIAGTDAADSVRVTEQTEEGGGATFRYFGRHGTQVFFGVVPASVAVTGVRVDAGGGDDHVGLGFHTFLSGSGVFPFYSGGVTVPARVTGGDGNDEITGGGGADEILGGAGDDRLFGGSGNDTVSGEAGADAVQGDYGDDTLSGGDGNDTVGIAPFVSIAVEGGPVPRLSIAPDNEAGNDTLSGGAGDDLVAGGDGNDTADGGDGNDSVQGNAGDDVLRGGAGDDDLGARGSGRFVGGDVEEIGTDQLFGGDGADTLFGGPGTDQIRGEAGTDTFYDTDSPAEQLDREPNEPRTRFEPPL
jgi:Ca2+-binding RTX toxin-like protein